MKIPVNWRERLNFYAFIASLLGEGDVYPPTEFAGPLSEKEVVRAWERTAASIIKNRAPQQLGIFIFVPFCRSKCLFCPFFSFPLSSPGQLDAFTESLLYEMRLFKGVFKKVRFNTLWFGGGTPSILEQRHLKKIFSALRMLFPLSPDAQITFECAASGMDKKKLKFLSSLGVNRITLGLQSLNDRVLKASNRLGQDRKTGLALIGDARKAGIRTINIDLMCGLPGDSISSFTGGLKEIAARKPDLIHINPFFPSRETGYMRTGGKYTAGDMERRTREAEEGVRILLDAGYRRADGAFLGFYKGEGVCNQQEIDRVRHASSYLSFGPSAESHAFGRMDYTNACFERKWEKSLRPRYIGCRFDLKEEMRKHIISNLRNAVSRRHFRKLFGCDIREGLKGEMEELARHGLISADRETVRFMIRTRQEQLILAKHFFNTEYLRNMGGKFKKKYDRKKNYFREVAKLIDGSV